LRPNFAGSPIGGTARLLLARVANFHRFRFLAAAIFVPLEGVIVVIDDLYHLADLGFIPGIISVFAA
jgi:hypothetical protein